MKFQILPFSESFSEAITYTLLHSLWQGLIVVMVLRSVLVFVAPGKSNTRYALTAGSLLVLFCASLVTFVVAYNPDPGITGTKILHFNAVSGPSITPERAGWLTGIISSAKEYIMMGWVIGACAYLLRFAGGYWFLYQMRKHSVILQNEWSVKVHQIAERLRIRAAIVLAESTRVCAPVVVGFIKPFIIIPAGLTTGLTTDQIEAIFIHELVHIKRNDYLLNILQSLMEAFLFFNPFVWMLSSRLRTEREHCCDDAVVMHGANAKAYVFALAMLEESRMNTTLAVSLAGNKNELLERIKRLMEKSVKNYSLKERIVPILFLMIGLMCASWFSIQKGVDSTPEQKDEKVVAADTSIRKKRKSGTYSRKKTTVVTPDAPPREDIIEEFSGDEDLRPAISHFDMDFTIPPLPAIGMITDIGPLPDVDVMIDMPSFPPFPDISFSLDTIPPHRYSPQQWKAFEEQFTKEFKETFGDFYDKNEGEFQKMMEDFEKKFEHPDGWANQFETAFRERAFALEHQAHALAQHEENMRAHASHMETFAKEMRKHEMKAEELHSNMKEFEEKMKKFESELKEELIRDGYLKSTDKIQEMQWDDEGNIEINGEKIKESDSKKYKKLHQKYFGEGQGSFHFSE
jgi:bla regulator protein blaR1